MASRIKNITGDGCRKSVICSGKNFGIKDLLQRQRLLVKSMLFRFWIFDDVYSIIRDSNVASQNVARRNGMSEVDILIKYYRGSRNAAYRFLGHREKIFKNAIENLG